MDAYFVTITGLNHYYGTKPFRPGLIVKLEKEHNNHYDSEAIKVIMPYIDTVGYVANSTNTVYAGTNSSGRIYDKIQDVAFAKIMFITHSSVIAMIMPKEAEDACRNRYDRETKEC